MTGVQTCALPISDLLLQFLPGNDLSGVAEQDSEQLERLALQLDPDSALPQLTSAKIRFENTKPDSAQAGRSLLQHKERP